VREDLVWLRENPLVRGELKKSARGFLWDITTGKAKEIKV